ncbi:TipJ family phage tail tip protein, partial [Methylorubrum thiocyanatum]
MTFDDDGPLSGAGALPRVHGAGGGGGKSGGGSASSAPDTLFSTATVRLVDLLGEGEIVGVRGGLKGIYLNDVPVQNEDGSLNFKGLTAEFRVGTPDQPYMAGYPDVQTLRNVGIKVNAATPVTASITDTDVDRLRVTIQVPSLFLAKSDGSVRANSVSYRVEARYSGGPWVNSLGDQTITGKTTSGYFRSHEIALPTNPSGASAPWQVRVTRLSPDTDDFNNSQAKFTNQSDLVFYSTTSIVDAQFSYPHSAMVGLTAQASSFGSSVPGRTYLVDGVLMPIPSNYDPVARTYSGVWDGTFKEGFSNNPAWALNLILRNDRFGLGEFIDTAAIDKWSLYEIGRYCDVPVSDGKGGQEPRYVFNGAISTQQEAFELLQLIAQVFRGTVYWSSGTVTAAQDRPSDPVLLVTEANALEGENGEIFSYASSGRRARHTVALVAWNDPDNLYKQAIEVVEDSDGVARYGYNPTRIDLLGCTSRGQAHRTGLWTLFTELHQTQVLTYRAGLDHAVIRPGDIVAVQDPQIANLDLSGRLKAGSTASVLVLDRPVTLASGAAYTISVVMPDGTVQEREISTGAGTVSSVTLRSALPQVPDPAAVWLIAGPIEPQLFRIVSIREEEPHVYAVAALQHEPGKYATIDDGAAFEPSPITEFPNIVLPPTNLSVRESQYTELGQPKQAMTLSWLPGQPFNSVAYFVTVIRPSGATVTTRTASQSIDFLEAEVGVWTFVVVAIGLNGKSSLPAQTTYTLSGWAGQAATTVAGLSVKGGGSTFTGRSCTVAWTNQIAASVPPYPVRNAVYVFDASTQVMVHREVLPAGVTEWTYDYFLNVNEGGPRRQFRVGVTAYSAAGDEGPPSYLTVSNPAPEIIVPSLGATSEVLFVDLPKVADADFAGYLVWVSETPNINPLTAPSYDVAGNSFPYRGVPDKTYYVRAAAYDAFSKDPAQLNVSAEQSKKLTIQLFDPLAPPIPGTPTLASNVAEIAPDGAVTAKVTIQWPAVTSTNLAAYEVAIAEGNNPAQAAYVGGRFVSGTTAAFAGLMPGRQYSFKVRSNPLNGFADSGWSPILVVTAALNTTPPNAPTLFTADPSFEAANLAWTNPSSKDLLGIEIWAGTTNVLANATLLKTVPAPASFYRDVLGTVATKFYWIRAVNTSDFKSGFVGPQSVTSVALAAAQLQAGIVDATKLASSIAANTVVASLPATKTTDYVTYQGQQYRWDATAKAYTKAVSAVDISGKIIAAQIDTVNKEAIAAALAASSIQTSQLSGNLDAARIAGTLTSDQIANNAVTLAKFASGLAPVETLGALPTTGNFEGRTVYLTTDKKLYRYNGSAFTSTVAGGDVTGDISAAQIAGGLTRATIAAGQMTGSIVATQITDGAVTTLKILAGAITASKLAVVSTNLAFNPDASQNVRGWALAGYTTAVQPSPIVVRSKQYAPAGFDAIEFSAPAAATDTGRFDMTSQMVSPAGVFSNYPVVAGTTYEFSACMSTHRCSGLIFVTWINASGVSVGNSVSNVVAQNLAHGGDYASFPKASIITVAPAGATTCEVRFRATSISAATPFIFVSCFMLAATRAGATETSPYVAPGITTIDGSGILTNSLTAAKIVAGSITTRELNVSSIFADSAVISNISTRVLIADAIKGNMVAAGAITADKISVSTSNRAFNADFAQGAMGWSLAEQGGAGGVGASGVILDSNWCPAGLTAAVGQTVSAPTAASGYFDIGSYVVDKAGNNLRYPVVPGQRFDISAYVSAHRCSAQMNIVFFNSAGAMLDATVFSNIITNVAMNRALLLDDWNNRGRLSVFVTVPDAAATMRVHIRAQNFLTGQTPAAYIMVSGLMITPAFSATQTVPSPYVPPAVTTIDGDKILTNTVVARHIQAGAIQTNHMTAGSIDANRLVAASITAGLIAGSTITGDKIAGRTVTAGNIVVGTLTGNEIQANSVNADRLVANSITAAQIAAGAIKADQIAAGAVTASKLLIQGANLAFNPDFSMGLRGWSRWDGWNGVDVSKLSAIALDTNWNPTGFKSVLVNYDKPVAQTNTSQAFGIYANTVDVNGNGARFPITSGMTYEVSCFMSLHRCQGRIYIDTRGPNGEYTGNFQANLAGGGGVGGNQTDYPRAKLIFKAPPNTASMDLYFMAHTINGDVPYIFVSGLMIAVTREGATETSPYEAPAATLIDGGNLFTGSLHANRITAGTITTDRIAAGGVHADRIQAGTITTNQIQAGGVHADRLVANSINSNQIAANSISASRMVIEARGIMPVNVYFEMERDANGSATGWLKWTAGQLEWIDDNGNRAFSGIAAGRMNRGSDGWITVWWDKTTPGQLWANAGNNIPAIRANPNCVLVATSADMTGVIVNWGGTVIDGDKIVANSIQARNIAANQIQTFHMAANSISGDRIQAGALSASKITTGTLTVNAVFSLGSNGQTDMYAHPNGGLFRVRNRELNQWRAAFGYIGDYTGDGNDFGLLL